jgi:hypothetical protein
MNNNVCKGVAGRHESWVRVVCAHWASLFIDFFRMRSYEGSSHSPLAHLCSLLVFSLTIHFISWSLFLTPIVFCSDSKCFDSRSCSAPWRLCTFRSARRCHSICASQSRLASFSSLSFPVDLRPSRHLGLHARILPDLLRSD